MWKIIIKFFLSLSSFFWFIIFLLPTLIPEEFFQYIFDMLKWKISILWITILTYLSITIILFIISWIILKIIKTTWNKSETLKTCSIKPAESSFLPTYIWLFVIALSLNNYSMIIYYSLLLFILRLILEKISYFNVFYIFFGYRFYEVTDEYNISYVLITKRKDLKTNNMTFEKLIRLNNFTFLES